MTAAQTAAKMKSKEVSIMDFYFIKNILVVLRIDKEEHKMYDIEVIPKMGEKVVLLGKRCFVSCVEHRFDDNGNEISHTVVLSLENEPNKE